MIASANSLIECAWCGSAAPTGAVFTVHDAGADDATTSVCWPCFTSSLDNAGVARRHPSVTWRPLILLRAVCRRRRLRGLPHQSLLSAPCR